jgi:hypothetical protein
MNVCGNRECETTILDSVSYCSRHQNKPKRKKKRGKKRAKKGGSNLDYTQVGMGLSRLRQQDELAWHARQEQEQE